MGNSGPDDHPGGVLFRHAGAALGSAGIRCAPQKGLRGSEVEGGESWPLVLCLPPTAALVIAHPARRPTVHRAQNFLKHSLPVPSSALQSTALALELGVI